MFEPNPWAPFEGWEFDDEKPADNYLSFAGILTHEIGHVLGLDHSGNSRWSPIEDSRPTMQQTPNDANPEQSMWRMRTLEDEDRGSVNWVGSLLRFWTSNSGFEDDLKDWNSSGTVAWSSSYAYSGSNGLRLAPSSSIWTMATYDPWKGDTITPDLQPGMTATPNAEGLARYKSEGDDGPLLRIKQRYLRYWMNDAKDDAYIELGPWSAYFDLEQCGPSTTWASCGDGFTRRLFTTNDYDINFEAWWADAVRVRYRVKNDSDGNIFVDSAGVRGGTTP